MWTLHSLAAPASLLQRVVRYQLQTPTGGHRAPKPQSGLDAAAENMIAVPQAATLDSNFDFLLALFGKDHANNGYVSGFPEDPTANHDMRTRARMWRGNRWGDLRQPLPRDWNNYFCISTFRPSEDPKDHGQPRRRKALHHATHVIVFDDVGDGQKVPWSSVKLPASYILMTSPGNHQVGYRLTVPEKDAGKVERLIDGLILNGLAADNKDPGMRGVTRYVRLPFGTNRKAKYGPLGVVGQIVEWTPERHYTCEDIAVAHSISLAPPIKKDAKPSLNLDDQQRQELSERMLAALEAQQRIIGEDPNAPGKWHVTCPWIDQHSDRSDSGTAYFEPGYVDRASGMASEKGGFKCHHGHCEGKHLHDLVSWLRGQGHNEIIHPSVTAEFNVIVTEERRLPEDQFSALIRNGETNRVVKTMLTNVEIILLHDRLIKDTVRYNTFTASHEITKPGITSLDALVGWMITEIERVYEVSFSQQQINLMMNRLLDQNRYDPLMQWATDTKEQWDGNPRIDRMFIAHATAEKQPAEYVEAVSRAFMLGAAHRALCPGYKFDNMLILEGRQGIGKSTLVRALCPVPEWAAAGILDVQHKDAVADLLGKFIYEVEELQTFRRTKDVDALKAFLSRVSDRVRLSYRRDAADYARRSVFIGTTNKRKYLEVDEPEPQRRFWPVAVQRIDLHWFQENLAQLWAEALWHAYEGELPTIRAEVLALVEREQMDRARAIEEHPWYQALVKLWNDTEYRYRWPQETTTHDVMQMLGIATERQNRSTEMVVADVLRALSYEVTRKRVNGVTTRVFILTLDPLLR